MRKRVECEDPHFYFSRLALEDFRKKHPPWLYKRGKFVPEAIEYPLAILENLKREGYEDGLCYVAKPLRQGGAASQNDCPELYHDERPVNG